MRSRHILDFNRLVAFNDLLDSRGKAITALWDCLDKSLLSRIVAKNPSKRRNMTVEIAFLDKRIFPNGFHQVVLIDGAARILDKGKKNIKCTGGELYRLAVSQMVAFRDLDDKGV